MSNEPTLVILIPGFPKDENDSTCLPAQQDLVLHINRQFPAVKLLVLAFQYPFQQKEYYWNGNKVIAFAGKNRGAMARRLLWYRVNQKLNRLKRENNITGVLSFWAGECAYVGKRWAAKNDIKHYSWVMGQDAKKDNKYIQRAGLRGEDLLSISDFSAEELNRNHGLNPAHIIPLGISPQVFPAGQKRDIDIITVGSLIPLKQYHLCIDIIREVKKQFPDIRMMLCGTGPEKERLASLVREHELTRNVHLADDKDHAEVLNLLTQSRILLHPSAYEGFGIACLEALAAGTPVISFQRPMKEPIRNWYRVDSTEAMLQKVLSLLNEVQDHQPVHPYTMADTVNKIMRLFGYQRSV